MRQGNVIQPSVLEKIDISKSNKSSDTSEHKYKLIELSTLVEDDLRNTKGYYSALEELYDNLTDMVKECESEDKTEITILGQLDYDDLEDLKEDLETVFSELSASYDEMFNRVVELVLGEIIQGEYKDFMLVGRSAETIIRDYLSKGEIITVLDKCVKCGDFGSLIDLVHKGIVKYLLKDCKSEEIFKDVMSLLNDRVAEINETSDFSKMFSDILSPDKIGSSNSDMREYLTLEVSEVINKTEL